MLNLMNGSKQLKKEPIGALLSDLSNFIISGLNLQHWKMSINYTDTNLRYIKKTNIVSH